MFPALFQWLRRDVLSFWTAEHDRWFKEFLVGADDKWLPEKLARSMARFGRSGLALVARDYVTGDGDDAPRTDCARRSREGADPFVQLYHKGCIANCSVVARRDAVLAAGSFNESLRNA